MVTTTERVNMSEMGTIITRTTTTRKTMETTMFMVDLMFLPKIGNLEIICHVLRI